MLIEVIRNGRRQRVHPKIGKVLLAKRIAKEISEDRGESGVIEVPEVVDDIVNGALAVEHPESDDLESMDRAALLAMADELGLKVHGRTGDEKIREIIREHIK